MPSCPPLLLLSLACACVCAMGEREREWDAVKVVRTHGQLQSLDRLAREQFQDDPLNRVLMASSNLHFLQPDPPGSTSIKGAWLTHITSDDFVPGARALGQSIVMTKSRYPLVLLYTDTLSEHALDILRGDGVWTLKHVPLLKNPNQEHYMFQSRLKNVYTKCHIYNQTEYEKIVYIDSDIIFLENSDELFHCPGYCAAFRHAFFNTGVIVARPSSELFTDLVHKFGTLPSYNGGEQGLMNSYFWDFDMKCPLFHNDPGTIAQLKRDGVNCGRLPAYYNGDIGPYYLHDASWLLPEQRDAPKLLHYTLGVFKPWQWWWYPVFDVCWLWLDVYGSIEGVKRGVIEQLFTPHLLLLAVFPFLLLLSGRVVPDATSAALSAIESCLDAIATAVLANETVCRYLCECVCLPSVLLPSLFFAASVCVLLTSVFVPFYLVCWIVGNDVIHPGLAFFLCGIYAIAIQTALGILFFRLLFKIGRKLSSASSSAASPRLMMKANEEQQRPLTHTLTLYGMWAVVASSLLAYSCSPSLYTLSSKIRVAVVVGIGLVYVWAVLGMWGGSAWLRYGYYSSSSKA